MKKGKEFVFRWGEGGGRQVFWPPKYARKKPQLPKQGEKRGEAGWVNRTEKKKKEKKKKKQRRPERAPGDVESTENVVRNVVFRK